ncbi:MAG: cardiolipin synthase ClsB [Comamonadaceae bacterium]|nr:cardiolipin synthase ClsB [Comamonadaceae bacterium]
MAGIKSGHHLKLLCGAQAFFDELVAAIDASVQEVLLETYIFNLEASGARVALSLSEAAQRGVVIHLVVDGVGTPFLPEPWPQRLRTAGVQWRIYAPLGRLGLLVPSRWRRLHRKLCVVDGSVAFCGGINVLDDLFDPNHGTLGAPRFDFAVRVVGPLVQDVHLAMAQFWWRQQAVQSAQQVNWLDAWQALQRAVQSHRSDRKDSFMALGGAKAMLVLRDNLLNRSRIERAYRLALGAARQEIILANAYFLPGRKIRNSLIHAARRGVRVRLLLQGRYEYFMQHHATRALYRRLLAAGVEIYEYNASFLHAKVAVVDGRWATVGSSNMDPLSLLLAREANVVIEDGPFAQDLGLELVHAINTRSRRVDQLKHAQRPMRQKLLDHAALLLMRLMIFIYGKRY